MAREPLNQFAERIIRCAEVEEFIEILVDKGIPTERLKQIVDVVARKKRNEPV